jgi:hypothetical protein
MQLRSVRINLMELLSAIVTGRRHADVTQRATLIRTRSSVRKRTRGSQTPRFLSRMSAFVMTAVSAPNGLANQNSCQDPPGWCRLATAGGYQVSRCGAAGLAPPLAPGVHGLRHRPQPASRRRVADRPQRCSPGALWRRRPGLPARLKPPAPSIRNSDRAAISSSDWSGGPRRRQWCPRRPHGSAAWRGPAG